MPDKKNLLIINGAQFGYSAGHYYYCKYLRDRFQIEFVCYDRSRIKMHLDGVAVHYVQFDNRKLVRISNFILTSVRLCKKIKPDVLFVVYFNMCFVLSIACRAKSKILDIRTASLAENKVRRRVENLYLLMQSLFFRKNLILSENLSRILLLPPRKTHIVPLGSEVYFNGIHDFRKLKLLYVGSLDGRRIYETIDGIKIFLLKNPHLKNFVTYTIIGFGTPFEEKKLIEEIAISNLQGSIIFVGIRNQDEIHRYFEEHNIGVAYIPLTDYYHLQPVTKIAEYALSGMFTIATDTLENRKLINSTNGTLCLDTPESFAVALEYCFGNRDRFNSEAIRNSLLGYQWEVLINNQLRPLLLK